MKLRVYACLLILVLAATAVTASDQGLVGHWDCNEGQGTVLRDRSGQNNQGNIHGAMWVKSGQGYALQFDGENDYVDCGTGKSLDITDTLTLIAWIKPTAINKGEPGIIGKFFESYCITYYPNGLFYISSGGNNVRTPLKMHAWNHLAATFDGTTMRLYINGEETSNKKSKFNTINHGKNFLMGCVLGDPDSKDLYLRQTSFFPGILDDVRVYNRVLNHEDIAHIYNLEAQDKGLTPFDTSRFGRFLLEPFFYPDEDRAVLSVNFRWMLPLLKEGYSMYCELVPEKSAEGGPGWKIDPVSPRHEFEGEFPLKRLKPGAYEFRALLHDGNRPIKMQSVKFQYPLPKPEPVVSPEARTVSALPPPLTPPQYKLDVARDGGLNVALKGQTYRVESSYSYPHGGENRFLAGDFQGKPDPSWQVTSRKQVGKAWYLKASGTHYTVLREIAPERTRISIKDTITNTTDEVIGVILSNYVNLTGLREPMVTIKNKPTIFVGSGDSGMGVFAFDDLYHLQADSQESNGLAEVFTEHLGLDKGAAYTIEWFVYPVASANYFDFVNQIRKDEGLNGYVGGTMGGMSRRKALPPDLMDRKNIAYARMGCLGKPPDDPTVSLEGYEFVEYPIESKLIKQTFAESKALYPDVLVMFHVAHSLFACSNPKERFPDSRALRADGSQMHYGPNTWAYHGKYFSRERFDEGWRWWIFYPTLENSFGKAMIEGTRYMLDYMGATAMWADGFISGYVRDGRINGYSYDRWDGHSVMIDPKTKLVTHKVTCVPWVALPVLKKVVRMIAAKGGITFTNGHPGPPSMWKEAMVTCCETGGGDAQPLGVLHLGRTLTPLGNPNVVQNARDVYRDIISKLDHGALYQWYGDREYVKHKTLVEHMYPITFESIHEGTVCGRERIVTKKPGVYGWHGDQSLHAVYLYDARGALTRNGFLSTVDHAGVRTELKLSTDQSAVVLKLPITLDTHSPVNLRVQRYDPDAIEIEMNGKGKATIAIRNGKFPIKAGAAYLVETDRRQTIKADHTGTLAFEMSLPGRVSIRDQ